MLPVQRFLINQRENIRRMQRNRIQKRVMRDVSDPFEIHDRRFIDLFRLNKDLVAYLFQELVPHMEEEQRTTRIPRQTRILIALRFFATGNYQRGIGEEYFLSASQQIVSQCIHEVASCISVNLGPLWIKFPVDQITRNSIKTGFMEKAGFPGIIGCIDCTHVAILGPSQEEHNYINRKGFHSKNVQIICSFNLEILNINARYPGSTNDAFIWRGSCVKQLLEQEWNRGERNNWLLGDSGYPLEPWLLTPFENPEHNTPEGRYNHSHRITRSTIERCNARLKLIFRCLLGERKLRYSPNKVGIIVNACAVLMNLGIRAGVEYNINFHDIPNVDVQNDNRNPILDEARNVRQMVVNRYFSNMI